MTCVAPALPLRSTTCFPVKVCVSPSLYTRPVPGTTAPSIVACSHASAPRTATCTTAALYATVTVRVSVTLALDCTARSGGTRATTVSVCVPAGNSRRASKRPPGPGVTAMPLTVTAPSVVPLTVTKVFSKRAPFAGASTTSFTGATLAAACG